MKFCIEPKILTLALALTSEFLTLALALNT